MEGRRGRKGLKDEWRDLLQLREGSEGDNVSSSVGEAVEGNDEKGSLEQRENILA